MYFPSNSVQTIELIEEDILYRTNQMKSLCLEAEQAGIATVIHLADQGEQLQQIEQHLTSIDQNLAENKHRINRLKSFLERIRDFLRPKGQPKRLRKARKSEEVLSKTPRETVRRVSMNAFVSNSIDFRKIHLFNGETVQIRMTILIN